MKDKQDKNKPNYYKPDWQPENAGKEFAVKIVKGVDRSASPKPGQSSKKADSLLEPEKYVQGVLKNDRTLLAKTITLIESNSPNHIKTAQKVLRKILPYSGKSIRVGITGMPGAGKSTLIETLGMYLIKHGHKVAVLTVDPSSSITKGSILGDKTRMEKLSREKNCFIRPSPSEGTLGGVARKSRETMLVCESAGYDIILIETVGVGQSEITVRSMVDFFLLLLISDAGDELQGIKKGVMELADALVINKDDGENTNRINISKAEYSNALHYIQPATKGWKTLAHTCSAITGKGIPELWKVITKFNNVTKASGVFDERRKSQLMDWIYGMIDENLKLSFYNDKKIIQALPIVKENISAGAVLPTEAAENLLKMFWADRKK